MQSQILIVDDEPKICDLLSKVMKENGYTTHIVHDGYEALKIFQKSQFIAVVLDIQLPDMNGLDVLERLKAINPNVIVIIITGYASIDSTIRAIKNGAYNYVTKPLQLQKIVDTIKEATSEQPIGIEKALGRIVMSPDIITSNLQMLKILEKVKLIAQSDSTVLVQGESGTGKELIAKIIHRYGHRANNSFIAVNCAALPESLLESEMFGHEKGAFTGAITRRIGKFEQAHRGTLLLDEVAEMPISSQAKFLRAIQEREIVRIGGEEQIKVDVRIIATTNKDLVTEVNLGKFREDLFYRLSVVSIFIPPLRERKDDIPLFAHHFAQRISENMWKKPAIITPEVMRALVSYSWPGNIRELENAIESALVLSQDGVITLANISFKVTNKLSKFAPLEVGMSIDEVEKELIFRTLDKFDGNKQKTANVLGITTRTLRNKLHHYT